MRKPGVRAGAKQGEWKGLPAARKKSCAGTLELRQRLKRAWAGGEANGEWSRRRNAEEITGATISAGTRANRNHESQQEPLTMDTKVQGGNPKDLGKC